MLGSIDIGVLSMDRQLVELPTSPWRPGDAARTAALEGFLTGGMGPCGNYCVWVEYRGHVTPIVWPAGFRARLDPLELLDGQGRVVARGGDYLRLGGAGRPANPREPFMLDQDHVFFVESKVAVSPVRP